MPRSNYEDATEPGAHATEDGKVAEPLLQRGEVPKDPRTNTSPPGSENNDVDAAATGPAATTSPKPVVDLAAGRGSE